MPPPHIQPEDTLASYDLAARLTQPSLKIVHISDLHFVTHPLLKRIVFGGMRGHDEAAIEALKTHLATLEVDLLFITGDLSTWGDKRSLRDALLFIKRLARSLGLKTRQVHLIPGNHDVLIDYRRIAHKSRNFTQVCGTVPMIKTLKIKGIDVAVFSFDSTLRHAVWPFTSNRGAITQAAFNEFNQARAGLAPDVLQIVQLHHHPLPIPYKRDDGVGGVLTTMTNGATFADRMQECGVHLVLHGHEHYPYVCEVRYHPEKQSTVMLSAGTACQVRNHEMSFNYIAITPKSVTAVTRNVYRETGFSIDRNATRIFR